MANPSEHPSDARSKLLAHFAGPESEHSARWSNLWDAAERGDRFLPFDRGVPNPALVDLLTDKQDLIGSCFIENAHGKRRRRALVPGCGRGYDVILLASFGYDAYGLEISATAVAKCEEEFANNRAKYPVKDQAIGFGAVKFLQGDFFTNEWVERIDGDGYFEFAYDYTFLSALAPSRRPAWSAQYSRLLRPTGILTCIEFPTYKAPSTGGPPFGCPPKIYFEHLSHPGEDLPYDDEGHVKEVEFERETPGGFIRVAHWQPERTHEIGKGTDWVSIWQHQ